MATYREFLNCSVVALCVAATCMTSAVANCLVVDGSNASPAEPNALNQQLENEILTLARRADYAHKQLEFAEAVGVYRRVLDLTKERYGEQSWHVVDISMHLSELVAEASLAAADRESLLKMRRLNSQAQDAFQNHQFERLEKVSQELTALADAMFVGKHSSSIRAREWLSQSYLHVGQYDNALPVLSEAMALCDALLCENHPTRIRILTDLASVERRIGKKENADAHLSDAFRLLSQFDPENLACTRSAYNEIVDAHCDDGDWLEAAKQLSAFRTFEEQHGDNASLSLVVSRQSDVELWRQHYVEGYQFFLESLRTGKKGASASAIAASLRRGIAVWDSVGDAAEAEKLIAELDTIVPERASLTDASLFTSALCAEAWHWLSREEYEKALDAFRRAYLLGRPYKLPLAGMFYKGVRETGWAFCETGQLEKAATFLSDPEALGRDATPAKRVTNELQALVLARLRVKQGKTDEARKLLATGLSGTFEFFGADSLVVVPYLRLRVSTLEACGHRDEASEVEKHCQQLDAKALEMRRRLKSVSLGINGNSLR